MTSYNAIDLNRHNGCPGIRFEIDEATGEPSIYIHEDGFSDERDACYPSAFEIDLIEVWCRHAREYLTVVGPNRALRADLSPGEGMEVRAMMQDRFCKEGSE